MNYLEIVRFCNDYLKDLIANKCGPDRILEEGYYFSLFPSQGYDGTAYGIAERIIGAKLTDEVELQLSMQWVFNLSHQE
jgi:hypothetical protein